MGFNINDILDFIYRNLVLSLIIAVIFIIVVVLIIYRLMHYNVNQTKAKYRQQKIVLAEIQQKEEELMYGEQTNETKKVDVIKCRFCDGEITDSAALHCPLCGTTI